MLISFKKGIKEDLELAAESWSVKPCPCGSKACTMYRLSFAWAEGGLLADDAKLAAAAPKLALALIALLGPDRLMSKVRDNAFIALQAALGTDNITAYSNPKSKTDEVF